MTIDDNTTIRTDTELFIQWRDSGESYEGFTTDELSRLVPIISKMKADRIMADNAIAERQKEIDKLLRGYNKNISELSKLYAAQREALQLDIISAVDSDE